MWKSVKVVSSSGQSNGLELEGAGFTFFLVSDLSKLKQFEQTRSGSYTLLKHFGCLH